MKKTEIIIGIIAIIGIRLKFLDIPLMGFLNTLILSTLAMFYYFFGFALFNLVALTFYPFLYL